MLSFFLNKTTLIIIIIEAITSTPINIAAKSAPYICQATILIIDAESKIITAEMRKEIFLKILPNRQKIPTLIKNAEKYGLAIRKYLPHKVYYKSKDGDLFIRNNHNKKPYPFIPLEIK